MRTIPRTLSLLAVALLVSACGPKPGPVTKKETEQGFAPPVTLRFTADECTAIDSITSRYDGTYFDIDVSLTGFESPMFKRQSVGNKLWEALVGTKSEAIAWSFMATVPGSGGSKAGVFVPVFLWGTGITDAEPSVPLPQKSTVLPSIYVPLNGTGTIQMKMRYATKFDSKIGQTLTEMFKIGATIAGVVPGTHSVSAMLTSEVADRFDKNVGDFFSDSQKPAFQPIQLDLTPISGIKCENRTAGIKYTLYDSLLPDGSATIEVRAVPKYSIGTGKSTAQGLPNHQGNSLKDFGERVPMDILRFSGGTTPTVTTSPGYIVDQLQNSPSFSPNWNTFISTKSPDQAAVMCGPMRAAARKDLSLNRPDEISLIAFAYMYRASTDLPRQALYEKCLEPNELVILKGLNFDTATIQAAVLERSRAADRLSTALREYGRAGNAAAVQRAWGNLYNVLLESLAAPSVVVQEAQFGSMPQLILADDGKTLKERQLKSEDAVDLFRKLVENKFKCGVAATDLGDNRWYELRFEADGQGTVSRIKFVEYPPSAVLLESSTCFFKKSPPFVQ